MNFQQFAISIEQRFNELQASNQPLFRSVVTGDELWNTYLTSFRPGDDPIFRDPNSSEHNCNLDKGIIRRYGNIVLVNEKNELETLFDTSYPKDSIYYQPAKAMSELLKSRAIDNIFVETISYLNIAPYERIKANQPTYRLGFPTTYKIYTQAEANLYGVVEADKTYTFHHFYLTLNSRFVSKGTESLEQLMGDVKSVQGVYKRGLSEISLSTLELVKDLILQDSILDGAAHLKKLESVIQLKKQYDQLPNHPAIQNNFTWKTVVNNQYARFRSELIGTLCVEIESGVDLETACRTWNKRVDPANYQKAKAPITKSQIDSAKKFVEESGYEASFARRFATIEDIDIAEIAHINHHSTEPVKPASIFDSVKATETKSTKTKAFDFSKVEEVSIDTFMNNILPGCSSVEAFLANRLQNNLVALTTATHKAHKLPFKWNNPFSYTFSSNLAGKSMMKEAVQKAGGKTEGALRFSISWNEDGRDIVDLDAHAIEPNRNEICFNALRSHKTGGHLDVDMIRPAKLGVENIIWPSLDKMIDGKYVLFIHNYDGAHHKGSKAEIEFNGETYTYDVPTIHQSRSKSYKDRFADHNRLVIAEVTLHKGVFTIVHNVEPSTAKSIDMWGLESQQFHKVNLVCLSPNHWGSNNIGNKYYLFMLEGCKSDKSLRSFHTENLNADLLAHKKVMEVLALSTQLEPTDKQLAGLGFNATVRDEVLLKVSGSFNRVIKVKF